MIRIELYSIRMLIREGFVQSAGSATQPAEEFMKSFKNCLLVSTLIASAGSGCGNFKPADILAESATTVLTSLAQNHLTDVLTPDEEPVPFEMITAKWVSDPMIIEVAGVGSRPSFDIILSKSLMLDRAVLRLQANTQDAEMTLGITGDRVAIIDAFYSDDIHRALVAMFPEDSEVLEEATAELTLLFPDGAKAVLRVQGSLLLTRS